MKQIFKTLIVLCILSSINFAQISLEKSEQCSSLKAKISPENYYEKGYVLNLEFKNNTNSWVKLRRAILDQQTEYSFDNVPSGEYRVTLLKNSKYADSKLDLKDITSASISLDCRERDNPSQKNLVVHPNPTSSLVHVHFARSLDQHLIYEIINSTGKLMMQGEFSSTEIDVSNLNEGQYFFSLLDPNGIVGVGNFIKSKK